MKNNIILILTTFFLLASYLNGQEGPTKDSLSFGGASGGCGSMDVFRDTIDKTKVILVKANEKALKLSTSRQQFEIGSKNAPQVYIDDYGSRMHPEYCTDEVMMNAPKPTRIEAVSGRISIYISKSAKDYKAYHRVTIQLTDVSFKTSAGKTYFVKKVEMKDVMVGWMPG